MRTAWFLGLVVTGPACGRDTPVEPGTPIAPTPITAPAATYYDLTVTAGQPCGDLDEPLNRTADTTLPEQVQSRTYTAAVTDLNSRGDLSVVVSGRNLAPLGFALVRSGDRLQFSIDGPAFFEELPNLAYLEVFGLGETPVANLDLSHFSIPFSGAFEYCVLNSPKNRNANCFTATNKVSYSICHSPNHQMTFTKR